MPVSLTKGQKVSLTKGNPGLSKVVVGLGWDVNRFDTGEEFDLDATAFMLADNGKVSCQDDFIFFGNLSHITKIAFAVTIYDAEIRRQNFGQVSNAFIRIYDETTGVEILRYDLGEDFSIETAAIFGELYKYGNEWKFNAIGSGYQGGLAAICQSFGIDVE